jgi:hypothetical protein
MSSFGEDLNYVIIDEISIKILFNLNVKQLLRLERVSKKFENCVYYALKRKKLLFIGNVEKFILCECFKVYRIIFKGNITQAFIKNNTYFRIIYDLTETENKLRLKSLLEKLSHIECVYLNKCTINAGTIQLLLNCCQRLRCLGFIISIVLMV